MDIRIKGDMDGTDTAQILRERFNIPVIYLTAHADAATLTRAKVAEPLGYITKPFQEAELHASIEIALHKHREDLKVREKGRLLSSTLRCGCRRSLISLDPTETIKLFESRGGSLDRLEIRGSHRQAGGRDVPAGGHVAGERSIPRCGAF